MHCNFICSLSDVIVKTFSQSVSQSPEIVANASVMLSVRVEPEKISHRSTCQVDRGAGRVLDLLLG